MRIICVNQCTFFCSDRNLKIYDENNNIFYFHPNKQKKITFNLPKGEFNTDNSIILQSKFLPYVKFNYPKLKHNIREFKIIEGFNPHKATISPKDKTILIDRSVSRNKYKPVLTYILCHEAKHLEIGGNRYSLNGKIIFNAEKECDEFARNYMLSHGYNPTQISIVEKMMLSDPHRNCMMSEQIKKHNFRR